MILDAILSRIRAHGPITAAEYMERALYDPRHGYYARSAQRSGRAGDFLTSVDAGPLFGEMLAVQFAEMWRVLAAGGAPCFDLVEAGAGNGRLSRDVLDAAARDDPAFYGALTIRLVERSPAARAAQRETIGPHEDRLRESGTHLPASVTGVIFANELLDAMPAHRIVMSDRGLREMYVGENGGRLVEMAGPLSDPRIAAQLASSGIRLPAGARADVSLAAIRWVEAAAAALACGFLVLIDYGRPAVELYSPSRPGGSLTTYRRHVAESSGWLDDPGERDITTHVDLTAVQTAAEGAGLLTLGILDQTYFLTSLGLAERLCTGADRQALARRLSAKSLIMPGGLGSTMKVMIFSTPGAAAALRGLAGARLT